MKIFLTFFLIIFSRTVMSACTVTTPYSVDVPLTIGRLSVGDAMPNGTVVMNQRIIGVRNVNVSCQKATTLAKFELSGGELYPNRIGIVAYKTGIEGLGVRFKQAYTNEYFPTAQSEGSGLNYITDKYLSVYVEFIKLGKITPGVIDTSRLPKINISHTESNNPNMYNVATYNLTGTATTIEVPTCTTPDLRWNLGSVDASKMKTKGDASEWVDTPITLTNCSVFYGNNANGSYTRYETSSNTGNLQGSLNNNVLSVKITPTTAIIDSNNGILGLDKNSTTSDIGIQLGSKQTGNHQPLNLLSDMQIIPDIGYSGGTITFPLSARMIKTSDNVTSPGKASTSVIYTINYK